MKLSKISINLYFVLIIGVVAVISLVVFIQNKSPAQQEYKIGTSNTTEQNTAISFDKNKVAVPFDIEILVEDYNPNENSCLIKIYILSHIEAKNVFVDLELPEGIDILNGDKSLWKGPILEMNEALYLSKKIIFLHDGIYRIGARITLIEGTAKTSKLALKFVKIENQKITVFDSIPKHYKNYKERYIKEKEIMENKEIIKFHQIKE